MDAQLFRDKVYIVTGGNAGIGLAVCAQLVSHGAWVYALDVHDEATAELSSLHADRLSYIQNDVRDRDKCHETLAQIISRHKRLDGLVNNAGVCPGEGPLPPNHLYDQIFDVNVRGTWNMGSEALAQMVEQKSGSIVNVGSTSSVGGKRRLSLYAASKHAVLGLTRSWALDFAEFGIRVNCIGPGPTDTAMSRGPLQAVMGPRFGLGKTDDELLQFVAASVPLRRIGSPNDMANTTLFLLSDLAGYVTGQILCVSGGT